MTGKLYQPVYAISLALCLIAVAAIIGGCKSTAPSVTGMTPANNATNVPTSPQIIQINFDQGMNRSTVEQTLSVTPAIGKAPKYAWADGDRVLTIQFPGTFKPNTAYTITVGTGAKAANDIAMAAPVVLKFTTCALPAAGAGPAPQRVSAGATETSSGASAKALTFAADIKPLAEARCKGCHGAQMTDYGNIKTRQYVIPGNPDQSRYYTKPSGKATHGGADAWKDKADLVRQWIVDGAAG